MFAPVDTFRFKILEKTEFRVCTFSVIIFALNRLVRSWTDRFPVATIFETEIEFETARLLRRPTEVMFGCAGVASVPRMDPFRFEIPEVFRVTSVPREVMFDCVF